MPRLIGLSSILLVLAAGAAHANGPESLTELVHSTHVHGLAFDPQDNDRVLLATHNGVYAFNLETEKLVSLGESRQDFMGFSVDTSGTFYGSGHPETGGNSGVITSRDGAMSWTPLSEGVDGPVDFHQLTVSPADPATLYGAFAGGLQRSQDGGVTWELVGPVPEGLVDLTASALGPDILYAATEAGLLKSEDGGQTWAPTHPAPLPVSFVETGPEGRLYAFVLGTGLVRANEDSLDWTLVSKPLGSEYILHFVTDGARAVAATASGMLLISDTGGESWVVLGG